MQNISLKKSIKNFQKPKFIVVLVGNYESKKGNVSQPIWAGPLFYNSMMDASLI